MNPAPVFENHFWWSSDGLRLHARRYAGPSDRPTLLCLPGLTRNARDFEPLIGHLAGRFPILAVDLRGRGESAWAKDPLSYVPLTYVQDLQRLIADLPGPFVFIGTSLGGIITMLMGGFLGDRLAGAILNDIGPVIEGAGLMRIRGYVGKISAFPSWMHCAQAVAALGQEQFPAYDIHDWLAMAKRLGCVEPSGRIVFDYDPKIAEPFKLPGGDGAADLWPAFDALATRPVLVVRGALSDLLGASTLSAMALRHPGHVTATTIPDVGHAPLLNEPEALDAIMQFLARFEG
jgi:pimeloyl-ACP methyl ester carboxylesterase